MPSDNPPPSPPSTPETGAWTGRVECWEIGCECIQSEVDTLTSWLLALAGNHPARAFAAWAVGVAGLCAKCRGTGQVSDPIAMFGIATCSCQQLRTWTYKNGRWCDGNAPTPPPPATIPLGEGADVVLLHAPIEVDGEAAQIADKHVRLALEQMERPPATIPLADLVAALGESGWPGMSATDALNSVRSMGEMLDCAQQAAEESVAAARAEERAAVLGEVARVIKARREKCSEVAQRALAAGQSGAWGDWDNRVDEDDTITAALAAHFGARWPKEQP